MNMFDIIYLIFLFSFGLKGFFNGIIKEVSDFLGLILGFTIGVFYYKDVGDFMHHYLPDFPPSFCYGFGFTLLVLMIWGTSNLIGYLVERKLSIAGLILVKILGIFVSVAKFVIVMGVIINILVTIVPNKQILDRYFGSSVFFNFERQVGESLFGIKPKNLEEFLTMKLNPLKESLTQKKSNSTEQNRTTPAN
ncbi:MAG: CvpA family protein [Campylobacterales bacterium]